MSDVFSFDPDRFVPPTEPAPVAPLRRMPPEWEHGLTLLADRTVPEVAKPERWAQILADCRRIASVLQADVLAAGWSVENLFGFDLSQPDGLYGLAVALRGGGLLSITPTEAVIGKPGNWSIHRPIMPPGSSLLWTFDERAPDP